MTTTDDLTGLRDEIDDIDNAILDLIARRTAAVEEIGRRKVAAGMSTLRPGREAMLLRRIVSRHSSAFPTVAIVRIWRELIAASCGLQAPLSIAVAGAPEAEMLTLARDHFGAAAPIARLGSAIEAIGAVVDAKATVAVVPTPQAGEPDPWWQMIVGADRPFPLVVGRLPIFETSDDPVSEAGAMALAFADTEPTGDDRSLVVFEADAGLSRAAVTGALAEGGHEIRFMDVREEPGDTRLVLLEIDGFVDEQARGLFDLVNKRNLPVRQIRVLGGFPAPLAPAAESEEGAVGT